MEAVRNRNYLVILCLKAMPGNTQDISVATDREWRVLICARFVTFAHIITAASYSWVRLYFVIMREAAREVNQPWPGAAGKFQPAAIALIRADRRDSLRATVLAWITPLPEARCISG